MQNFRLLIAYDGSGFLGWQKTRMGPSIEESLQSVLEQILQHPIQLQAASRTDAGVHADGQVVNFFSEKKFDLSRLLLSSNCLLPSSIVIREAAVVPFEFHPTLDALGKEYRYKVCIGKVQMPLDRFDSWHLHESDLDLGLIRNAIPYLLGEKDFVAFCNTRDNAPVKDTVCRLEQITVGYIGEERLQFALYGNRFLFRMARNVVGTLVDIGRRRLEIDRLPLLFQQGQRKEAGVCAPAHGLRLHRVKYPSLNG